MRDGDSCWSSVRATADAPHHDAHPLSHVARSAGPRLGDRVGDEGIELAVAELGRQVCGDQLRLALLLLGELTATAPAELLRGVQAALALAPQHGELVAVALLRVLLELRQDESQGPNAILLAGLHGRRHVCLDPLCECR